MTTKTQAAKAFAEKYGSYSPSQQTYVLASSSATSRTFDEIRQQTLTDAAQAQRDRADSAIADLQAIMHLLGADKRYEDDVTTHYVSAGYYSDVTVPRTRVTKTALTKFREDIRTVNQATDAAAALDRLTGGIK